MDSETEKVLNSFDLHRVDLGLERVKAFLKKLGNPQDSVKWVHVAGTNGKGSVCTYIASCLAEEGYKTGLYLSPHLLEFSERIQVNGKKIPGPELKKIVRELMELKEKSGIDLSYFEFLTAVAFQYFEEKECDFGVLEVGMGGRLDATNVIVPEASVITRIGLDHQKFLGNKIESIALEKAGIVKEGIPVISALQEENALKVIREECEKNSSALSVEKKDFNYTKRGSSLNGQEFDFLNGKKLEGLKTRLIGEHQFENASLATHTLSLLGVREKSIRSGLKKAFLPGRFQIIHNSPFVLADAAHNPMSTHALKKNIQQFFPQKKALFVLGISEDKEVGGIVEQLIPVAGSFICTQAKFRGMKPKRIQRAIIENGFSGRVSVMPSIKKAAELALNQNKPLTVFTGSFYSVGEALNSSAFKFKQLA